MNETTAKVLLDFMERTVEGNGEKRLRVTFHGGEPLEAGIALWRTILEGLARRLPSHKRKISVQSNLWDLDDAFLDLFFEHKVEVGTSLDGPETVTDTQRGKGYFARTMAGVNRARRRGLSVGCIATFTARSARKWEDVFTFFLKERLDFSVHATVSPLEGSDTYGLTPSAFGRLLRSMLDRYVDCRQDLRIASLDQLCQAVAIGEGKVCTFVSVRRTALLIETS